MITNELKSKIDGFWDIFKSSGLQNSLDIVEQITYLMLIRNLDEAESVKVQKSANQGKRYISIFSKEVYINNRKVDGEQLRWSVFCHFADVPMYSVVQELVFPFYKNIHGEQYGVYSKYMNDAIFKIPTPKVFSEIVESMETIYKYMDSMRNANIRGEFYEYLLTKVEFKGMNGQFKTPVCITKMIVEMMSPKHRDTICDPACGTSDFLVEAGEYIRRNNNYINSTFKGFDMDRTLIRIGAMNILTYGINNAYIDVCDSLSEQNCEENNFSLIMSNPPFKGSVNPKTVSTNLLKICKTKKIEILFLAVILRMLKTGGRGAVIVPSDMLSGSTKAHKDIKSEIIENHKLEVIISISDEIFKSNISASILIFTKTKCGGTDNVWFYNMEVDSDVTDVIKRFKNLETETERERSEKNFFVPKMEIVENGYDLSFSKYKKEF